VSSLPSRLFKRGVLPPPRYGTPFLLSLGLSEQLTSLVWLAGPISGLIAQPVIGEITDDRPDQWANRGTSQAQYPTLQIPNIVADIGSLYLLSPSCSLHLFWLIVRTLPLSLSISLVLEQATGTLNEINL
jgi:hypothetical protein